MKHGKGLYSWPDGRKLYGNWYEGKQHGKQVYESESKEIKEGLWKNGKKIC